MGWEWYEKITPSGLTFGIYARIPITIQLENDKVEIKPVDPAYVLDLHKDLADPMIVKSPNAEEEEKWQQ